MIPRRTQFLLLLLAATAVMAAPATRQLQILLGRGELLQFDTDIQRVAVAEPKVADAVVVSAREVMVNAKGLGATTVVVWEAGKAPTQFQITVKPDTADWDVSLSKAQEALRERGIQVQGSADSIVLTGEVRTAEEYKTAGALGATLSKNVVNLVRVAPPREPRQIQLHVTFASIDRVALSEFGVNLFSRNPAMMGATSTQQFSSPRFSQFQFPGGDVPNPTINFADLLNLFLYRPDLGIGVTIKALQSRNLLQILAEPTLIAIEGSEASFLAGGQFPFPTLAATTTGGAVAPVVTVQFKNFGVELNFLPTITDDNQIRLKVSPSVSALDYSNSVTLQGFLIPAISTRTATTEVMLKDGESFAIAGLLDNRVIQSLNKIPWIGDVPILGTLFKSRSTKKTSDELLVVITPRFVKPLTPEERAKLPQSLEPFLQSAEEEYAEAQAKIAAQEAKKKNKGKGKTTPAPAVVGPSGYQTPPPPPPPAKK